MTGRSRKSRRHPRFNVDVEAVVRTPDGERLTARTRDVSRSGICVITYTPLPIAQPLSVELVLAFGQNAFSEPLRLEAHVVWCTTIAGHYQVGAMFDHLTSDHYEFLDMFLRFLDGSLTPRGVVLPVDPGPGQAQAQPAPQGGAADESWDDEPSLPPDVKDDPFRG